MSINLVFWDIVWRIFNRIERHDAAIIKCCNGGDRPAENIPEQGKYEDVIFAFGVGGKLKIAASSHFLEEWGKWYMGKYISGET